MTCCNVEEAKLKCWESSTGQIYISYSSWNGRDDRSPRPDDLDGEIYVLHEGLTGLMSL